MGQLHLYREGRTYTSQNKLQVPMTALIGSRVLVRYDTKHPEKLHGFSLLRVVAALIVTVICIFAAALI